MYCFLDMPVDFPPHKLGVPYVTIQMQFYTEANDSFFCLSTYCACSTV